MTRLQLRLLKFIMSYTDRNTMAPSYEEMMRHMDVVSKSNIHRLLTALEAQGWISRGFHTPRAITVLKDPGQHDPYSYANLSGMNPAKLERLALDILAIQQSRRSAA